MSAHWVNLAPAPANMMDEDAPIEAFGQCALAIDCSLEREDRPSKA